MSSPSSIPGPRNDSMEVRFALSNDDLKTRLIFISSRRARSVRAMRNACSRDSITHGPAMKRGGWPPPKEMSSVMAMGRVVVMRRALYSRGVARGDYARIAWAGSPTRVTGVLMYRAPNRRSAVRCLRKAIHSLRKAKHGLRKAKHGLRKAKHGLRKAKHGLRKAKHGLRKAKHGLRKGQSWPLKGQAGHRRSRPNPG